MHVPIYMYVCVQYTDKGPSNIFMNVQGHLLRLVIQIITTADSVI